MPQNDVDPDAVGANGVEAEFVAERQPAPDTITAKRTPARTQAFQRQAHRRPDRQKLRAAASLYSPRKPL